MGDVISLTDSPGPPRVLYIPRGLCPGTVVQYLYYNRSYSLSTCDFAITSILWMSLLHGHVIDKHIGQCFSRPGYFVAALGWGSGGRGVCPYHYSLFSCFIIYLTSPCIWGWDPHSYTLNSRAIKLTISVLVVQNVFRSNSRP